MTNSEAQQPIERCAGGVVLNENCEVLLIVPVRRAADGSKVVGLPKGHPEAGESLSQAAQREIREETGVNVDILQPLGETTYQYLRAGRQTPKAVSWFLALYRDGSIADHDHEVEKVFFSPVEEAKRLVTYRGEQEMIEQAELIAIQQAKTCSNP